MASWFPVGLALPKLPRVVADSVQQCTEWTRRSFHDLLTCVSCGDDKPGRDWLRRCQTPIHGWAVQLDPAVCFQLSTYGCPAAPRHNRTPETTGSMALRTLTFINVVFKTRNDREWSRRSWRTSMCWRRMTTADGRSRDGHVTCCGTWVGVGVKQLKLLADVRIEWDNNTADIGPAVCRTVAGDRRDRRISLHSSISA